MNAATPARLYATLVGGAFVVAGVLGFFYSSSFATGNAIIRESSEVLGIFAVNGWDNLIYIATGLVGLAAAGYAARTYSLAAGLAYVLVAIWGFIVVDDGFGALASTVPVDTQDNLLHLILGLTGLAAGAATPKGSEPKLKLPTRRLKKPKRPVRAERRRAKSS